METYVLKFGGSSVSNNINLNIVAKKIIKIKKENKNVVVVVSAQGNTTDKLIKEAKELSFMPDKRELDALISVGEQITATKLSILLNRLGYSSISLNGWQAGIKTDSNFQNARIVSINSKIIENELNNNKIVIITGFQGIDIENNITTLGRGGSDTSAVAVASVLKAKKCIIYSDVDGIYTVDPSRFKYAEKLDSISYKEMSIASNEGAKVLHDRCVQLAEKDDIKINTASTFKESKGTIINNNIEKVIIKNIIKNDETLFVRILFNSLDNSKKCLSKLVKNKIKIFSYKQIKNKVEFYTTLDYKDLIANLFDTTDIDINTQKCTRISIIGGGISNDYEIQNKVMRGIIKYMEHLRYFDVSTYKISIQFDTVIEEQLVNELYQTLF